MIAQEHAPSYQQQHNPTGSQALHLALLLCFRHGLLLSPEKGRGGEDGETGGAAALGKRRARLNGNRFGTSCELSPGVSKECGSSLS